MRKFLSTAIALAGLSAGAPAGAQNSTIELLIPGQNDTPPARIQPVNPLAACLANPNARVCATINNSAEGGVQHETFVPNVQYEVLNFDPNAKKVTVVPDKPATGTDYVAPAPVTNYVEPVPEDKPIALPSVAITIEFDFDSDQLRYDQLPKVQTLANALKDPSLYGAKFAIIGHTDAKGSDYYNCDLSNRRARTVTGVLQASLVQLPLYALGMGEAALTNPYNPNAPENRRVTILRLPDDPTPILATAAAICGA